MTELSLRQLHYFDALATHSHFGRAAAACAISQPAMSMQIKDLEEALGAVLIERGARQVRLTKFGEETAARGSATSCARSTNWRRSRAPRASGSPAGCASA